MQVNLMDLSLSYGHIASKYNSKEGRQSIASLFAPYITGKAKIDEFQHTRPGLYRFLNEIKERECTV